LENSEAVVASIISKSLSNPKRAVILGFRKALEFGGFTVARIDDYYSPLPSSFRLRANAQRWNRPSALRGVEYDIEKMKREFVDLLSHYLDEFLALPPYAELQKAGFGPGYTAVDALTLYLTVRHLKPQRYIEVGSGLSTYYCSLAAERNAQEGHPLEITCIEPYPFDKLKTISGIELVTKEVQDVDPSVFKRLGENDILFIDSSHVLKVDGDVSFLFLEIFPLLNVGVSIHVHDVPFPYNVPFPAKLWMFWQNWPMFWNEAMVLQAFLCFNEKFKITMSTPIIRHFDEAFLKAIIPKYETIDQNPNTFSSIWLKRVS
jgi:hypothetical protein